MTHTSPPLRHPLSRLVPVALMLIAPLALLLFASGAHAEQPMTIVLKGSAEVPPVSTSATGTGQITVFPDHTIRGSVKLSGMTPTMAHIHEAAAGKNGPPIITLSQSGDGFAVPADAKLSDAQYASYVAGNLYVNVHSSQYPNGELRGQLLRTETAATPTTRPAY